MVALRFGRVCVKALTWLCLGWDLVVLSVDVVVLKFGLIVLFNFDDAVSFVPILFEDEMQRDIK